jgi:hypothetical protein
MADCDQVDQLMYKGCVEMRQNKIAINGPVMCE